MSFTNRKSVDSKDLPTLGTFHNLNHHPHEGTNTWPMQLHS
ncbi:MAG: hypothetical protein ACI9QQ_002116 [Myxococcota bacterium]|jgi:hypothetical protein